MSKIDAKSGSPRKNASKKGLRAASPPASIGRGVGGFIGHATPDTVRRKDAGKYVAWSPDGLRIVAVATSFASAERKARKAGYPQVAIDKVPKGRTLS